MISWTLKKIVVELILNHRKRSQGNDVAYMSKMIKSKKLSVVIFVLDNSKEGNLFYW